MRRGTPRRAAAAFGPTLLLIAAALTPVAGHAALPSLERSDWMWSSEPVMKWAPDDLATPVPVSALVSDHARLEWYIPRPDGPTAARQHDLNPLLTSGEGGNAIRPVLEWSVKPPTGTAGLDPEDWTGLTQRISSGGIDLSKSRFIEIWVNDFTSRHDSTSVTLRVDLGVVSEDAYWDPQAPPNGILDTEDKNFDGKLDLGTGPGDPNFEDTGLDNRVDENEPGYDSATNPDPNGDDYHYDAVANPDDYSAIDNFEYNGLGSATARPDTEDLNRNSFLDLDNDYFEATIDLADTAYVAIDVPADYAGNPNVVPGNGWRLFRVPFSGDAFRIVGTPSWASVTHLRFWIGDMPKPIRLQIGGISIDGLASPPAVDRVALYQNRPNPFNPLTTIPYELEKDGHVRLLVFDVHGRLVQRLVDAEKGAGRHYAEWDGKDRDGRGAASGVYIYRIDADGKQESRRMALIR